MINNTIHTSDELKAIIIPAFRLRDDENIMIDSPSYCNESLVEFSENDPIDLGDCIDYDGAVSIMFSQTLSNCPPDCCSPTKYEYTLLLRTSTLKDLVTKTEEIC
jgi:hypothetical protein